MTLRVLEFGENVAAGYAGRLFALGGAEVIRVDNGRGSAFTVEDTAAHRIALDAYLHAGKRRIGLDWQAPAGRALLDELAGQVDIVVSDAVPAELDAITWERLGAGSPTPPAMRTSITPFGLTGPYRDWQATGSVLLAMGGYTYLMGDPDRPPLTMPGHYVEYQSGQYAYLSALAVYMAMARRSPSHREPRALDISMYETVLSLSQFTVVLWTFRGTTRRRHGNRWENAHPISLYRCRDGWVVFNIVHHFWETFAAMLGEPGLADDPRFSTNAARMKHQDELDAIINARVNHLTMREVLDLGQRDFRVPTGAMLSLEEVLADPHLQERAYWQPGLATLGAGPISVPGPPWRYPDEPRPQPLAGAPRPAASSDEEVRK